MKDYLELEPAQERAIIALLSEPTLRAAASSAGISETTLWRWLRDPHFKRAYRRARRETLERATTRLAALVDAAVEALGEIVADRAVSPHVRVSAASRIVEYALKAAEIEEVQARLERLEAAL
jgi:hypothetical protein